jgi:DNA-binding MarR family transcriptional regulator
MTERYFHTDKEKRLLEALSQQEGHTVNQLSKISELPRPIVTNLLARFMRWDLATMEFDQNIAKFRSKE